MNDRCVMCGDEVPEGMEVCPKRKACKTKYEKCADCIDREFIGTKHEKSVCSWCDLEEAKRELCRELKKTAPYKMLIRIAEYIVKKVEKFQKS